MKKFLAFIFLMMLATFLVACAVPTHEKTIPDKFKDYFDDPQAEKINLSLEEILTLVADASLETVANTEYPVMKLSSSGLIQFIMNTSATEYSEATSNSLFFEFAQATHLQLAAYTDQIKLHSEITKFDLNVKSNDLEADLDLNFTGGFYIQQGFAYYHVNMEADLMGTPANVQIEEKISTPLPHDPISFNEMPESVAIPEFNGTPGSFEEMILEEFVGQIDVYLKDGDYVIDITFNKAFVVQFVTNMYNEYMEQLEEAEVVLEDTPELAEILAAIDKIVKSFTFKLRYEIKDGKLSKMAIYIDLDVDFLASEVAQILDLPEESNLTRFKLLIEDLFYAIEYVNTFPSYPDFSDYEEVEQPSILEAFAFFPMPGSPQPEIE